MKEKNANIQHGPRCLLTLCLMASGAAVLGHPEEECSLPESKSSTLCEEPGDNMETNPVVVEAAEPVYLAAADFGELYNTGYIDSAFVRNQFRVRYDWNRDSEFPDRAEFIYGQCDCNPQGVSPGPARDFSYEEFEASFEYAFTRRFSLIAEIPYRDVDLKIPEAVDPPKTQLGNDGIGDIRVGIKYAILAEHRQYLTFQLKGYLPTGDEKENLGTGHSAIEPGLLYNRRLDEHWTLEAEARWWHPTGDDTDYAGDVLRLGAGVAYGSFGSTLRFTPVTELVGWYVVDGDKTNANPIGKEDASGDTIVNLKLGFRIRAGNHPGSVYLGYGFALTDEDWYDEVFRVEYRHDFAL
jgi:hypothetical protein